MLKLYYNQIELINIMTRNNNQSEKYSKRVSISPFLHYWHKMQ